MRALTVQQPWAWAIIHGGKSVENRTQAWGYRGPLAIHAGARVSDRGMESPLVLKAAAQVDPDRPVVYRFLDKVWRHESLELGAIIGVVELVDVHQAEDGCCGSPWAETSYAEHGGRTRRELVHLVLEDPVALAEGVPCRGSLGLWTVPADVLEQVGSQLRAADDLAYQRVVEALARAGVSW